MLSSLINDYCMQFSSFTRPNSARPETRKEGFFTGGWYSESLGGGRNFLSYLRSTRLCFSRNDCPLELPKTPMNHECFSVGFLTGNWYMVCDSMSSASEASQEIDTWYVVSMSSVARVQSLYEINSWFMFVQCACGVYLLQLEIPAFRPVPTWLLPQWRLCASGMIRAIGLWSLSQTEGRWPIWLLSMPRFFLDFHVFGHSWIAGGFCWIDR